MAEKLKIVTMADEFGEAQTYMDPDNPSEEEQKHVPIIEADTTVARVKVGEVKHPMEEEHFIQWIEIFLNGDSQGKINLQPYEEPEAEFDVDLAGAKELRALAFCNIHGLWENKIKLK